MNRSYSLFKFPAKPKCKAIPNLPIQTAEKGNDSYI